MKLWKIIKTLLTLQSTLSASLFMEIIVYFHLSSFLFQCTAANSMAANEPSASSFSHRLVTMGNLVTAQTRVAVGTKEFYSSVQDTHNQECSASMRFFHSTWSIFQQRLNIIYWEYRKKHQMMIEWGMCVKKGKKTKALLVSTLISTSLITVCHGGHLVLICLHSFPLRAITTFSPNDCWEHLCVINQSKCWDGCGEKDGAERTYSRWRTGMEWTGQRSPMVHNFSRVYRQQRRKKNRVKK